MQTSKQPFPPDFVYLLHAAVLHPIPDHSASNGGDEEDVDKDEDEEPIEDDDAD